LGRVHVGVRAPAHDRDASNHTFINLRAIVALVRLRWMGRKLKEGGANLDRGINCIVDLDGGLLGRLCVCLHRRCRRRMRDARCDERVCRTRL